MVTVIAIICTIIALWIFLKIKAWRDELEMIAQKDLELSAIDNSKSLLYNNYKSILHYKYRISNLADQMILIIFEYTLDEDINSISFSYKNSYDFFDSLRKYSTTINIKAHNPKQIDIPHSQLDPPYLFITIKTISNKTIVYKEHLDEDLLNEIHKRIRLKYEEKVKRKENLKKYIRT